MLLSHLKEELASSRGRILALIVNEILIAENCRIASTRCAKTCSLIKRASLEFFLSNNRRLTADARAHFGDERVAIAKAKSRALIDSIRQTNLAPLNGELQQLFGEQHEPLVKAS